MTVENIQETIKINKREKNKEKAQNMIEERWIITTPKKHEKNKMNKEKRVNHWKENENENKMKGDPIVGTLRHMH